MKWAHREHMDAALALLYLDAQRAVGRPKAARRRSICLRSIMARSLSVCVFCGSSFGKNPAWASLASATGAVLARHGAEVVYGGGRVGLMGLVADAALAEGGRVAGIIPRHLARAEVEHAGLTELIETETMSERKTAMIARSDAFVVLPGGFGTLDELLDVLTLRQLAQHDKPTVIVDAAGYWQNLRRLLEGIVAEDFARPGNLDFMTWIGSAEELPRALGL